MSVPCSKCLSSRPLIPLLKVQEWVKSSSCRNLPNTSSSQFRNSTRPLKLLSSQNNNTFSNIHNVVRSFVSTPVRCNDDNPSLIVDKDPNFVMPSYNPPEERVVSPEVEKLFKDILKLQPQDIAIVGHLLMRRLCVSNEDMMMIVQSRLMGGTSSSQALTSAETAAPVVEEKKIFDLKLVGFDEKSKIKVIKEIRAITGLGLKEAKDLVDGVPKVVKKDIKKEEADQIKEVLTKVGAVVEIV